MKSIALLPEHFAGSAHAEFVAEMGDAALFLASPMASYITGQMLLVDSGIALM